MGRNVKKKSVVLECDMNIVDVFCCDSQILTSIFSLIVQLSKYNCSTCGVA